MSERKELKCIYIARKTLWHALRNIDRRTYDYDKLESPEEWGFSLKVLGPYWSNYVGRSGLRDLHDLASCTVEFFEHLRQGFCPYDIKHDCEYYLDSDKKPEEIITTLTEPHSHVIGVGGVGTGSVIRYTPLAEIELKEFWEYFSKLTKNS